MESFKKFFANFSTQMQKVWGSMSLAKRIAAGLTLLAIIAGVGLLVSMQAKEPFEYLFVNLSPEDTTEIVSHLRKANFHDYVVDDRGVKVPTEQVTSLRLKLAQEGLPAQGIVGWEKFDTSDFTRTEFEQQINKMRAIQGELSRTIMGVEGILSARVHIVAPKNALFVEDKKDPTAAVYIKTKRGFEIDRRQVKGIVHLVSRSVEGLKPENIVVIDFEGKMLTEEQTKDPAMRQTKEMLTYKAQIEKQFEERIRAIVGRVVGPERVEAKVDVIVDSTQEEQTISDLNPDKAVVVSQSSSSMELAGSGLNPTGVPGAKSNVPGEQEALNIATSTTENSRTTERVNYEVAKTISKRVLPVGNITRISAAVLVDGKQPYPVDGTVPDFEPRTEDEMRKIDELVRSAVGFVDGRDVVKVHNMLFQLDHFQVQAIAEQKKENRDYISTLVVSVIVALSLVFFFAFIVRPYFRWLSYDPERKKSQASVEEYRPDLELGAIQHVQVKEDVPFDKLSPQEQVLYLAKHEPVRTTEAIRMLLNPHQTVQH